MNSPKWKQLLSLKKVLAKEKSSSGRVQLVIIMSHNFQLKIHAWITFPSIKEHIKRLVHKMGGN